MSFGENTQLVEVPEEQEAISLIRRLKSRRDGASADCRCAEDTVKLTSARAFDGLLRIMNHARDPLFRRHRFPAELIGYAVLAVFSVPAEPADGRGNAGRRIIARHEAVDLELRECVAGHRRIPQPADKGHRN
jgi:hypothetical protein